ncbi:hypothetical protein Q5752_001872 [Cryptotrichosporon argae]
MSIEVAQTMLRWLVDNGGHVEPSLVLAVDPSSGLGLHTTSPLAPDTPLVACPFELAITPAQATAAVCATLGLAEDALVWAHGAWNERMRVAAYLGLHWVAADVGGAWPEPLKHRTYLASLPPPNTVLTPLHWTEAELELLDGTNLAHVVRERRDEWVAEGAAVRAATGGEGVTWERYLAAATYLSSRSFPSRLLSLDPDPAADSHPVLLPGLDLLNHARGQPVTWLSSLSPGSPPRPVVSISCARALGPSVEVYNNYGPKANDELVLGYGFALRDNPDDTVALRLGVGSIPAPAAARLARSGLDPARVFCVRRDGEMDSELVKVVRVMLGEDEEDAAEGDAHDDNKDEDAHDHGAEKELHLELDVLDVLAGMVRDKAAKLEVDTSGVDARDEVRHMCDVYRQGQKDILAAAIDRLEDRIERIDKLLEEGMRCPCCA